MLIQQIKAGYLDNFSYIVGCEKTGSALVVDPAGDADRFVKAAENAGLKIEYILNTHGHSDHTAGNTELKQLTGALVVIHKLDAGRYRDADIELDKEETFQLGECELKIIHTPGHTPGGICLYAEGNLITGDTLFVGDSGRTDLPGGHRPALGASIRKLMTLPDETVVWPGHDYGPTPTSTIGWEKKHNVNAKEYGFYKE